MNEELLESANLHALGLLTGDALDAFVLELDRSPGLREEVRRLREANFALACSAPTVAPPADLRAELLAAFEAQTLALSVAPGTSQSQSTTTNTQVSPTPPASPSPEKNPVIPITSKSPDSAVQPPQTASKLLHFIPWAAAAALGFLLWQDRNAISQARQETAAAHAANVSLKEREEHILAAAAVSEAGKNQADSTLKELRQALATAENSLANLGKERDALLAELGGLRDDDKLNKTRIAVLGSLLKNQPQAVAVSLWRQEK
ncbi:MAG: hypothetical protein JWL81_2079, partial [Verrucomicrobiales bacterium]|nr:hypothetical protein [Verrucomicrobiales bacterium]